MPTWRVHNKWAKKLAPNISKVSLNFVNKLIDNPEKVKEFVKFFAETRNWFPEWRMISPKFPLSEDYIKEIFATRDELHSKMLSQLLQLRHDSGRMRNPFGGSTYQGLAAFVQLKFLSVKGSDYIKVWYLHHLLDLTIKSEIRDAREIIKRVERRTRVPEFSRTDFKKVKDFFEKNFNDILNDIVHREDLSKKD